jgi:hypothetical protein
MYLVPTTSRIHKGGCNSSRMTYSGCNNPDTKHWGRSSGGTELHQSWCMLMVRSMRVRMLTSKEARSRAIGTNKVLFTLEQPYHTTIQVWYLYFPARAEFNLLIFYKYDQCIMDSVYTDIRCSYSTRKYQLLRHSHLSNVHMGIVLIKRQLVFSPLILPLNRSSQPSKLVPKVTPITINMFKSNDLKCQTLSPKALSLKP